jgi:hypothetical protein
MCSYYIDTYSGDYMSENQDKSLDILGLKPYGEAVNTLTKGVVEGAGAFLSKVCLPASEELGLLLKDKVSGWRKQNLVDVTQKFENKMNSLPDGENRHAHPRIITLGLERASWADSDEVQEMWAGLLTSSCTADGKDDSNLIFINLLDQLTSLQAKILNYACQNAKLCISKNGFIYAEETFINLDELIVLTGVGDLYRLDRELDHLRSLDILHSGFSLDDADLLATYELAKKDSLSENNMDTESGKNSLAATITPTGLGVSLYVRSQGTLLSPIDFFGLSNNDK